MTKESYIKLTGYVRNHPRRIWLLNQTNHLLTAAVFLGFPVFLLTLFLKKDPFLLRAVLVPGISFLAVTLFRKVKNAPRPYEKFDIPPVLKKDTSGQSFPSRHVFSIFIIAATIFQVYRGIGIVLFVCGAVLALIRVIGGVHEPRDVIAGALIGLFCGFLGFSIL